MKARFLLFPLLFLPSLLRAEIPEDYRYRYEVLGTGLKRPMTMQMAPDGKIFFNELDGKLRLLDPVTKAITEVGEIEVFTQQESGFLGFALDPKFAENGHIFIQHSPKGHDATAISRFTIKEGKLDLSSQKELLRWPVQRKECCHHAGEVHFGADGNLYFSTGDNTSPFQSDGFTPIDERDGRYPFDAQKSSANTNDLRGKINRIRPTADGGYTIPEGNLFPPGTEKTRPEIYAMGFRNPWRFTVDEKSGILYVGDVGPDSGSTKEDRGPNGFDTVSQIRKPAYLGWPYSRGGEIYRDFDFAENKSGDAFSKSTPTNTSPNNTGLTALPPVTPPMIWYPGRETEDFPLLGSGGRTACVGEVFHFRPEFAETDGFPDHYDGSLLWFDWQRPLLMWAMLDKDSNFTGLEKFSASARLEQGDAEVPGRFQIKRPVDTFFGPDGCLYLMDYGETWGENPDARIIRVSYQRGNLSPLAVASVENSNGKAPLTVSLSGAGSSDPEGGELRYEWISASSGKVFAEGETAETTIKVPGTHELILRVTDSGGATSTASAKVTVGNTAPVITFIEPEDGAFIEPGVAIPFRIRIDDAEDGSSDGSGAKAAQMKATTLVTSEWTANDDPKGGSAMGMTLMKQSDCFNCHATETRIVGPSLVEIADKYRGQAGALDVATDRVLKGSAGVWGEVPMLPHPQHTKDELHMMVEWIFSLEKGKGSAALHRGTEGEISVPAGDGIQGGIIQADFTDFGNGAAGALSSTATVKLRSRTIEAELADEIIGPKVMGQGNASGKKVIGNAGKGHVLKFSKIPLASVSSITVRYAIPHADQRIEIREGSPDGEKIGEIPLPATGEWAKYTETNGKIVPRSEKADLYFVLSSSMNIDWLRFEK